MDDAAAARRDYYITTVRIRWAGLTPRERKRLWKLDPLMAISIRHLIEDNLI